MAVVFLQQSADTPSGRLLVLLGEVFERTALPSIPVFRQARLLRLSDNRGYWDGISLSALGILVRAESFVCRWRHFGGNGVVRACGLFARGIESRHKDTAFCEISGIELLIKGIDQV